MDVEKPADVLLQGADHSFMSTRWQDEVRRMLPGVRQRDHDYKYFGRIQPTVKYLQLNSADAEET